MYVPDGICASAKSIFKSFFAGMDDPLQDDWLSVPGGQGQGFLFTPGAGADATVAGTCAWSAAFAKPLRRAPERGGKPRAKHASAAGIDFFKVDKKGCPCCIGPPDDAFESACAAVAGLGVAGVGVAAADRFVRTCQSCDRVTMQLSKKKRKLLAASLRGGKASGSPPLTADEIEHMQAAVRRAYNLGLEHEEDDELGGAPMMMECSASAGAGESAAGAAGVAEAQAEAAGTAVYPRGDDDGADFDAMKAALESAVAAGTADGVLRLRTVLVQMGNCRCPTRAELKRTGIGALLNRKLARSEVADVAQVAAALLSRWRTDAQQAAPHVN